MPISPRTFCLLVIALSFGAIVYRSAFSPAPFDVGTMIVLGGVLLCAVAGYLYEERLSSTPVENNQPATRTDQSGATVYVFHAGRQDQVWHLFSANDLLSSFDHSFFNDEGPVSMGHRNLLFRLNGAPALGYQLSEISPDGQETLLHTATRYKWMTLTGQFAWSITHDQSWYDMRGGSFLNVGGNFTVTRLGRVVGRIRALDFLGGAYRLEFTDPLPHELILLILLLCVTYKRNSTRSLFGPSSHRPTRPT